MTITGAGHFWQLIGNARTKFAGGNERNGEHEPEIQRMVGLLPWITAGVLGTQYASRLPDVKAKRTGQLFAEGR